MRSLTAFIIETLDALARSLATHHAGARAGSAKSVHDLRRHVRRLRSTIWFFKPWLNATWRQRITDDLKWLAQSLGHVRDCDVIIAALRSNGDAPSSAATILPLEALRLERVNELIAALGSARYQSIAFRLEADLIRPWVAGTPDPDWPHALASRFRRRFRKFRTAGDKLDRDSSDTDFHALRKRAKDLRHAAQVLARASNKKSRQRLKRLQHALSRVLTALGARQDSIIIQSYVKSLPNDVRQSLPPQDRKRARKRFSKFARAWSKLTRRTSP